MQSKFSFPKAILQLGQSLALLFPLLLFAGGNSFADSDPVYSNGPESYGGTGRYYMGREIAGVMSYRGADWLEREEREQTEKTALVIKNLALKNDDIVADIGAGSGYFARRIARQLPAGEVIAVDIQPQMLAILTNNARAEGISNIRTVLATPDNLKLEPGTLDLALMVDVYHELANPREIMAQLLSALKPGGKVVLLEYRAEDKSIPIIEVHKMTESQAKAELTLAGFEFVENADFLPTQHFLVFARPLIAE
jgi:ubiquinone/menaquinone biosynthesis C-methylase UbiE